MIVFDLKLDLTDREILEVKEICRRQYGEQVRVAPGRVVLGHFDPTTVLPLASLLISFISLCLNIRRDWNQSQEKRQWTAERLQSLINSELLKVGVTRYGDLTVRDFAGL